MADRSELARLWQSVLETDPNRQFGRGAERLAQRPGSGDELPQPGFVGPSYRPGGVLFLGKNPGKGTLPHNTVEEAHIRALRNLKFATSDSLLASFGALMEDLARIMSAWDIASQNPRPGAAARYG